MKYSIVAVLLLFCCTIAYSQEESAAAVEAVLEPVNETESNIDTDHILYRHRLGVSWSAVTGTFKGVQQVAEKNMDDGFRMLESVRTYPLQVIVLLIVCFILFTAGAVFGFRKLRMQEDDNGGE